jgi:hypothetical protein
MFLKRFHGRYTSRVAHIRPVVGRMWGYSYSEFARTWIIILGILLTWVTTLAFQNLSHNIGHFKT